MAKKQKEVVLVVISVKKDVDGTSGYIEAGRKHISKKNSIIVRISLEEQTSSLASVLAFVVCLLCVFFPERRGYVCLDGKEAQEKEIGAA